MKLDLCPANSMHSMEVRGSGIVKWLLTSQERKRWDICPLNHDGDTDQTCGGYNRSMTNVRPGSTLLHLYRVLLLCYYIYDGIIQVIINDITDGESIPLFCYSYV